MRLQLKFLATVLVFLDCCPVAITALAKVLWVQKVLKILEHMRRILDFYSLDFNILYNFAPSNEQAFMLTCLVTISKKYL